MTLTLLPSYSHCLYLSALSIPSLQQDRPQVSFDRSVLEGSTDAAIDALNIGSAAQRPKWLDSEFYRQQREQVMVGSRHRHWLVSSDQWLLGVSPTDVAEEEQRAAQQEQDAVIVQRTKTSVPVDDNQRTCALSGEPFETVFDEETQEWHYKVGWVRGREERG